MYSRMKLWKIFFWCMSFIFKKYFLYVFLFIMLVFVQQFCTLLIPQYIQQFIGDVTTQNIEAISQLLIYLLITVAATIIARPLYMLCKMVFCEKATCDIQYSVVDKARILGYDYFENTPRGQMLSETYQNVLSIYLIYENDFPNMIAAIFAFIIATLHILAVSPLIFDILLLACYVLIASVVIITKEKIFQLGKVSTEKTNEFYRQNYDLVESREEILASHAQVWFSRRLINTLIDMFKGQIKLFVSQKKVAVILAALQVIAIALFLFFTISTIGNNEFFVGEIVAVLLYLMASIASLVSLANLFITLSSRLASVDKPYSFFKLSPSVVEKKDAIDKVLQGDIVFQDVSFSYSDNSVLRNLNLVIRKGEHVVIVGESGSGKTTLLKLLLRYYDISQGMLTIDGLPIDTYTLSSLREYIGIVFQETFLFSGNIWDNLEFACPGATEEQVKSSVELACMDKVFDTKVSLIEKELTNRGENLSGGERQRLSIARLFLKNPNIVLLDEVTSALDYITEHKIMNNIFEFFVNKTIIMTSHRLSAIQKFDRILVISGGNIVQDGNYDEVSKKGSYFSSLIDKGLIINA